MPALIAMLGLAGQCGLTPGGSLPTIHTHVARAPRPPRLDPMRRQRDAQAALCRRENRDCGLPILRPADGPITASASVDP